MLTVARRAYAAVWLLALIPLQAIAQVPCVPGLTCPPPDTTPPKVRITSPASGATVSGTITVTADASDNNRVAGVQFQSNGINFGAEATSPPYQVTANTNAVPDGSYTLTAVARDAHQPIRRVEPFDSAPRAAGVKRYEETDPSVSYSLGWDRSFTEPNWIGWSGGSAVASPVPGARATFTFTGTSVSWIGFTGPQNGIARVILDGSVVADSLDMYAAAEAPQQTVFTLPGLTNTRHTLTIEVTGLGNPASSGASIVVDAFDVTP